MGSQVRPHNPEKLVPGLSSWVIVGRPFGTYRCWWRVPRTDVLGYSQTSLRDWNHDKRSSHAVSKAQIFFGIFGMAKAMPGTA